MTESKLHWTYGESDDILFNRVEEMGGWPSRAKSLVFQHTCESKRPCYFSAGESVRNEWNTSFKTADDYYLWKLSDKAKNKLKEDLIREFKVRVSRL